MSGSASTERRRERVVLIGFRGCGKTTLGRALADRLGWDYLSTDEQTEAASGRTIPEIVARDGWPVFRQWERQVIAGLRERMRAVIDCGGGVIEDARNMAALAPGSLIVWVDAAPEVILQRLRASGDRPLLNQDNLEKDIVENYRRREPLYRQYGEVRVDTSDAAVEGLCGEVERGLGA